MFDSVKYNLSNPAFTEDIGEANMNRMPPMSPATFDGSGMYFPGITGSMSNVTMRGILNHDKVEFESQKDKDKRAWKNAFKIIGLAVGGVLCWKFGKKLEKKVWNGIKTLAGKIKAKFKKP